VTSVPYPFLSRMAKVEPIETVRKGFEQRSERRFGQSKEGEIGGEVPSRRSVGLRYRGIRGFSDGFSRAVGNDIDPSPYREFDDAPSENRFVPGSPTAPTFGRVGQLH
jgi:hypothetical protein